MAGGLERHAQAIQSIGALTTAAAALAVVVFMPWQIAANDRTSRAQTAREIYLEFLNLSIQRPNLAARGFCTPDTPVELAAYEACVNYLLYTSEQVMDLNPADWQTAIAARLRAHHPYLCTFDSADLDSLTPAVAGLISGLLSQCEDITPCAEAGQ